MKAALYALHYIHSTHDYGISFMPDSVAPMHSFIHFPPSMDAKAYSDAFPPQYSNSSTLLVYSDTCWGWGSQVGSAAANGTPLWLLKFRSMNRGINFHNCGPFSWLGVHQEYTPSALVKLRFRSQIQGLRNLSIFTTSVKVH